MTLLRALGLLLIAGTAFADDGASPPDELLFCTTCHGVQLMGNSALGAPRLSGLPAWYTKQQLRSFKSGWRGTHEKDGTGLEMLSMAQGLSEVQVDAAAVFVSATRSPLPVRTQAGNSEEGELFYMTCATCHGTAGEGNKELGSPPLKDLNDWYMIEQLRKFRSGQRGFHPDDAFGLQMKSATDILPNDRAIADVVAYIMTLKNDNNPGDP